MVLFVVVSGWLLRRALLICVLLLLVFVRLVVPHWVLAGAAADREASVVVEGAVGIAAGLAVGDAQVYVGDAEIVVVIVSGCEGRRLILL